MQIASKRNINKIYGNIFHMLFKIANKNAILKRHNLFTFYTFCATMTIIMSIY